MHSVIVTTESLAFWDEVSVKKAVLKILKGRVNVVAHNGKLLGHDGDGNEIWDPLIIQVIGFPGYKCKKTTIPYSHQAVFDRDDNYCQYWHEHIVHEDGTVKKTKPFRYKCTEEDRTIDHVVPLSRGGSRNSFENTVCACRHCNEIIKRNRTPVEAGLRLITKPRTPSRKLGELVKKKFVYNPRKESHRKFIEIHPEFGYRSK